MTKAQIIKNAVPEVSIEELFLAQGIDVSSHPPRPSLVEVNQRILEKAVTLVHPVAMWQELDITGTDGEQLLLQDGPTLTSGLLTTVAASAEKLILFGLTIGTTLDEQIKDTLDKGNLLEAYTLNAAGGVFMNKSIAALVAELKSKYKEAGMGATLTMGPGHAYWPGLEDVGKIVRFLGTDKIGLTLTESNLMMPQQSIALVMGVGAGLPDHSEKTPCDFCSIETTCTVKNTKAKC